MKRIALAGLLLPVFVSPAGASAPGNDSRSSATVLSPTLPVAILDGTNEGATLEASERCPGDLGGASVWYSWTPSITAWVAIDTTPITDTSKNLDTVIALYDSGAGLIGFNDRVDGNTYGPSRLVFQAQAGKTYEIAVYGFGEPADEWSFELRISNVGQPATLVSWVEAAPNPAVVVPGGCDVGVSVAVLSNLQLFPDGAPAALVYAMPAGNIATAETSTFAAGSLEWGTGTNGVYGSAFNLLSTSATGAWILQILVPDPSTGELLSWTPRGDDDLEDFFLMNASAGAKFNVATSSGDQKAPELTSFVLPSSSVETLDSITATMRFSDGDTGSGFENATVWLYSQETADAFFAGTVDSSNRISGNARLGDYSLAFELPESLSSGSYSFVIEAVDSAGNSAVYRAGTQSSAAQILSLKSLSLTALSDILLWRKQWFGTSSSTGSASDQADPDNDGISNFLEFAAGASPLAKSPPIFSLDSSNPLAFRFRKGKSAAASGFTHTVEWVDSLGDTWRTDSVSLSKVSEDSDSETMEATVSVPASKSRFFRLKISK